MRTFAIIAATAALTSTISTAAKADLKVGDPAPPLSVSKWVKGTPNKLTPGKVHVVEFWATWCGPCKAEMPILMKLQQVHGPAGLVVLGVSMDEEGASVITPWLQKTKFVVDGKLTAMNFPILIGTPAVSTAFGEVEALPATFIIDRKGKIVERHDGAVEFKDVDRIVKPLLAMK